MLTLLRRIGLRHVVRSPLRSGLVVLGIALGVAVVVAAGATSDGMVKSFDELVARVAGRASLIIEGNESGIPGSLVAEVAQVPGVAHAAGALEVTTTFIADGQPLLILGVDFLGDTHFLPFRGPGGETALVDDPLEFVNDPHALLIARRLADERGLREGSTLEVLGASGVTRLKVRGILDDSGPAASFGGRVGVMFLDAAQVTFARGTLIDRIDVAAAEGQDVEQVATQLRSMLDGRATVQRPEHVGERLRSLTAPLRDVLWVSGVIALLVAVFIIYNAIGVAVAQRRKEIGVLRALGVLRREVVLSFCLEACVLALFGVGLGLLLARELVHYTHLQTGEVITSMYGATSAEAPHVEIGHALRGAAAGMVVAFIAALLPAGRGARIDPVLALRGVLARGTRRATRVPRLAIAGGALVLSAIAVAQLRSFEAGYVATVLHFVGCALLTPLLIVALQRATVGASQRVFGLPGRLALDYVDRDLGRSTVNVLALMVAIALSVAVSGWLTSFERSLRTWFEQVTAADMTLTAGSRVADQRRMRLAPDTPEKLSGIPGLAQAQPMRIIDQRHGPFNVRLIASDLRAYLSEAERRNKPWQVLDGASPVRANEPWDQPRVIVAENAAQALGVGAGDHVTFETPTGPVDLQVRAVVVDYSSDVGSVYVDRALYVERWLDPAIDALSLYLEPHADGAAVSADIRARLGGGAMLFITETGELRDEYIRMLHDSFGYARSLELIVLVIALLGVIGTMVAAVIDRTREIGMLRAVGATRRQVASAIVLEAAFLGLCASVAGMLTGALECKLVLDTVVSGWGGWSLPFVFPVEGALRIGLLALVTAALAGLVPAVRAARLLPRDALSE